ncbi:hypothetical protein TNCV_4261501 [Trichonephila clavipes]|nr:hypothetical protein TNCV_4261501 [Trichonephila clavipes]
MGLYERKSAVLDGFQRRCEMGMFEETITSQNIYGGAPTVIRLAIRPSRLFLKFTVTLYPSLGKDQQHPPCPAIFTCRHCWLRLAPSRSGLALFFGLSSRVWALLGFYPRFFSQTFKINVFFQTDEVCIRVA